MKHHLIKHQDKPILISGYSRRAYTQHIAEDILYIIVAFFDTSITWSIPTKNFPSTVNSQIFGDPVIINGVEFKPLLKFGAESGDILFKTVIMSFESNGAKCRYQLTTSSSNTNSAFISLSEEESAGPGMTIMTVTHSCRYYIPILNIFIIIIRDG